MARYNSRSEYDMKNNEKLTKDLRLCVSVISAIYLLIYFINKYISTNNYIYLLFGIIFVPFVMNIFIIINIVIAKFKSYKDKNKNK